MRPSWRAALEAVECLEGGLSTYSKASADTIAQLSLSARVLATGVVAVAILDATGRLLFLNPAARWLLQRAERTASAATDVDTAGGEAFLAPPEIHAFRGVALTGTPLFDVRSTLTLPDGQQRILSVNAAPLSDGQGSTLVAVAINDLTDQYEHYERALRESEERLKLATEAAGIGVWELDLKTGIFQWDEQMLAIYGLHEADFPRTYKEWARLVISEHQERLRRIERERPEPGERREEEFRIHRADGRTRHIRAVWQCLENSHGEVARLVGTNEDVTEQRELQEELEYRAAHDPLTDLCNRAKIQQLMRAALAHYNRHGTPFALLLFDVDHFKSINDFYGHSSGDAVLWHMARRIENVLREDDHIGRWGGEEFLIVASSADEAGAQQLAERVRCIVSATPFEGIGHVTISIGVTAAEPDVTLQALEQRVDRALYAAKSGGRNQTATYSGLPSSRP